MWTRTALAAATSLLCTSVSALNVAWGDWIDAEGMLGTYLEGPAGTLTAIHGGNHNGRMNCIVGDQWAVGTYNGPVNKPQCSGVRLAAGGAGSVSFSATVHNPLLALLGWGDGSVEFSAPFELISSGPGFYGDGSMDINAGSTGFTGSGKVHAILRFNGAFDAISWNDSSDAHRGYTVGLATLAPAVPEPGSAALMLTGIGLFATAHLRRRMPKARGDAA